MKLLFESWLLNQKNLPAIALEVLNESISCYKFGAYRGSMILAFTGFQLILRERILSALEPNNLYPKVWDRITGIMANDEQWDHFISSNIIPCTDANKRIFEVTDDLINQYTYWKNRRNDAAHSKNNKLGSSHLESFWLFIESNLPKFAIKGSHQELTNRIKAYMDLNITEREASYSGLIRDIPKAINMDKIPSFLSLVKQLAKDSNRPFSQKVSFMDALLDIPEISGDVIDFFLREENNRLLFQVIRQNPSRLSLVLDKASFIRRVYMEWLFQESSYGNFTIMFSIHKHSILPELEAPEILRKLFDKWYTIYKDNYDFVPLEDDVEEFKVIMRDAGQEKALKIIRNLDLGNDSVQKKFFIDFITFFGFNEEIVEALSSVFKGNYPYGLFNSITAFLKQPDNNSYKVKLIEISTKLGCELPKRWTQDNEQLPKEDNIVGIVQEEALIGGNAISDEAFSTLDSSVMKEGGKDSEPIGVQD